MQRNNLKMCLRSMDAGTDTSEVAKVGHDETDINFMMKQTYKLFAPFYPPSALILWEYCQLFLYCLFEHEGIWWRRFPKFQLFHNKDGRV